MVRRIEALAAADWIGGRRLAKQIGRKQRGDGELSEKSLQNKAFSGFPVPGRGRGLPLPGPPKPPRIKSIRQERVFSNRRMSLKREGAGGEEDSFRDRFWKNI